MSALFGKHRSKHHHNEYFIFFITTSLKNQNYFFKKGFCGFLCTEALL